MKVVFVFAALLVASTCKAESLLAKPYSSAQVNEFAERLLTLLRPFIVQHNLDPVAVSDITANFTLNFLGEHDGTIILTNGFLMGLSTIELTGDSTLQYELRLLNIRINGGVSEVTGIFDYDLQVMGMHPTGILTAKINDLEINISVLLDMKETTATLQHLEVTNIGKIDIHLSGNGWLSDLFFNAVVDVVTGLFKNTIVNGIVTQVATYIDQYLRNLPPILPHLPEEGRRFFA